MTSAPATYGYKQVADRIEHVLGERPEESTMRTALVRRRRTAGRRPGIATGLPAPLPSEKLPARFSADAVEEWLAAHPRLAWDQAVQEAREGLAAGKSTAVIVHGARTRGLSWRQITEILNTHDGGHRSVSGVHKRYRRLDEVQP